MLGIASRIVALLGLAAALPVMAEEAARVPMPIDWSHRHLIYSNPDTPAEAFQKGTLDEWIRNYRDPRFVRALVTRTEREASGIVAQPDVADPPVAVQKATSVRIRKPVI